MSEPLGENEIRRQRGYMQQMAKSCAGLYIFLHLGFLPILFFSSDLLVLWWDTLILHSRCEKKQRLNARTNPSVNAAPWTRACQQMQTNVLTHTDALPHTKFKDCASEAFSQGACLKCSMWTHKSRRYAFLVCGVTAAVEQTRRCHLGQTFRHWCDTLPNTFGVCCWFHKLTRTCEVA